MLNKSILSIAILMSANFASAQTQREVDSSEMTAVPYQTWRNSPSAALMNLYPGFDEPEVDVLKDGVYVHKTLRMVMLSTRAKTVVNKPIGSINLNAFLSDTSFRQLDSGAVSKKISTAQTMPVTAGKLPFTNFGWCNEGKQNIDIRDKEHVDIKQIENLDIFLPGLEKSQAHMKRPDRDWCVADQRTVCYESCRLAPKGSAVENAIKLYNNLKKPYTGRDKGIATQNEIRIYKPNEFAFKGKIESLTGVATPVGGAVEITQFYVNQIMVYGKMMVIFQQDPKDAQKTVVSVLSTYGAREDAWNHKKGGILVQGLLKSAHPKLNADSGILAGIPKFTKNAAAAFADILEK